VCLVSSVAFAGDVRGFIYDRDVLAAGGAVNYNLTLKSDQLTEIGVKGDGDGDIDCWLYDQNNNLVSQDVDATDTCYLTANPIWTGAFKLRVKNNGSVASVYELIVK
jgi:hypothetical protein